MTVVEIIIKNEKDAAAATTANTLQISLVDEIVSHRNASPPQCPVVVVSPLRRRPPCPDPEEFLNAIKMEKINLNRSPEDNKKLNVKQKKRLSKLKEQHFKRLGLQRRHTNRSNSDSSAVESAESDDQEEFVPNKKIKVGRPSVTLRVRNNREQVAEKTVPVVVKKPQRNLVSLSPNNKKKASPEPPQKSISSNTSVPEPMSRSHENSLILSTKHKAQTERTTGLTDTSEEDRLAKEDLDDTICLCTKPSKYYTEKSTDTRYCRAVDEIESQLVGCCNETDGNSGLLNLLRSSVRVSYMILCRSHKERLAAHHCCAGCGIFCTQGAFILCARNHLFHRNCATKFILNAPFNPRNPNVYECPTLVLKCPHCGSDAPERENCITMTCRSIPVFQPNQLLHRVPVKRQVAKMSIGQHRTFSGSAFPLDMAKLMPTPVADVLVRAQRTFPFTVPLKFSYRDLLCAITKNDIERFAEIIGELLSF